MKCPMSFREPLERSPYLSIIPPTISRVGPFPHSDGLTRGHGLGFPVDFPGRPGAILVSTPVDHNRDVIDR